MSEQVLRAGEAARQRRKLHRTTPRIEICQTSTPDSSTMPSSWFATMLQRPLLKPLSAMEKFSQFSGFLYVTLGAGCILAPKLASLAFSIELNVRGEGYSRLAGIYFLAIGICYVTSARSSPRNVSAKRILLGTVFERLLYVNSVAVLIYLRHNGNMLFTCCVMAMDTILALITFVLWTRETTDASLVSLPWALKKVLQLLPPNCEATTRKSSSACQILGYVQGMMGTVFVISPELAQHALRLDSFEGHSKSILALGMMSFAVTGILHIFAGAADCLSFNIMAVFQRVVVLIPLVSVLAVLGQIELGLAGFFICFDGVTAFIVLFFLYIEGLNDKRQ